MTESNAAPASTPAAPDLSQDDLFADAPPTTRVVIVEGQQFSVPYATPIEAIRQQLVQMGFANVASAKAVEGTVDVEGQLLPSVEFVKQAGTKGLDTIAALVAAIVALPPVIVARPALVGPNAAEVALIAQLLDGGFTIEQLAEPTMTPLDHALNAVYCTPQRFAKEQPCLDVLCGPVAASDRCVW